MEDEEGKVFIKKDKGLPILLPRKKNLVSKTNTSKKFLKLHMEPLDLEPLKVAKEKEEKNGEKEEKEKEEKEEKREKCPITLEYLDELLPGEKSVLGCGHKFQKEALKTALSYASRCPVCRMPVESVAKDKRVGILQSAGISHEEIEAELGPLQASVPSSLSAFSASSLAFGGGNTNGNAQNGSFRPIILQMDHQGPFPPELQNNTHNINGALDGGSLNEGLQNSERLAPQDNVKILFTVLEGPDTVPLRRYGFAIPFSPSSSLSVQTQPITSAQFQNVLHGIRNSQTNPVNNDPQAAATTVAPAASGLETHNTNAPAKRSTTNPFRSSVIDVQTFVSGGSLTGLVPVMTPVVPVLDKHDFLVHPYSRIAEVSSVLTDRNVRMKELSSSILDMLSLGAFTRKRNQKEDEEIKKELEKRKSLRERRLEQLEFASRHSERISEGQEEQQQQTTGQEGEEGQEEIYRIGAESKFISPSAQKLYDSYARKKFNKSLKTYACQCEKWDVDPHDCTVVAQGIKRQLEELYRSSNPSFFNDPEQEDPQNEAFNAEIRAMKGQIKDLEASIELLKCSKGRKHLNAKVKSICTTNRTMNFVFLALGVLFFCMASFVLKLVVEQGILAPKPRLRLFDNLFLGCVSIPSCLYMSFIFFNCIIANPSLSENNEYKKMYQQHGENLCDQCKPFYFYNQKNISIL